MAIHTLNPATGDIVRSFPEIPAIELYQVIDKTHDAFLQWKRVSITDRIGAIAKLKDILALGIENNANTISLEMGKPITQARGEIEKSIQLCDYYISHAEEFLKDCPISSNAKQSYTTYNPLGVILLIMPWNFPFWQVFRAAIPALLAGNTIILKHAPNVPQSALTIEAIFQQAGLPPNAFRSILIENSNAALAIVHKSVQAISFTGSSQTGSLVAAQAGSQLKKVVLELGGSDPYLIFEDANLELAAQACARSRLVNCGQTCIAAKRILVHQNVLPDFIELLKIEIKNFTMGDPMAPETTLGPLAREDLRDKLHVQVQHCLHDGARLVQGGSIPKQDGFWYTPTLLTDVDPNKPSTHEEIFGPVLSLISFSNEAEAIQIANQTEFGLGAAIFTQDIERGKRLAQSEIEAGSCFVNHFVQSDPRLPFGGIKQSGYGRELSRDGLLEFTNKKTVAIF